MNAKNSLFLSCSLNWALDAAQGGLAEECPAEDRQCLQAQGPVGIPGKFPGQVPSLPETSHSFPVCFTVQWLATSRMKVTAQFVKNTHPIICWIIFILYFPGCK